MSSRENYTKLFAILMLLLFGLSQGQSSFAELDDDWPILNGAGKTIAPTNDVGRPSGRSADLDNLEPVTKIDADAIFGVKSEEVIAEGDAKVSKGDQQITADRIIYRPPADKVFAIGHVRLEQTGFKLLGEELEYSVDARTGQIDQAQYFLEETGAHGTANTIIIDSANKQRAFDATYSTCEVTKNDVYVETTLLTINHDKDSGVAAHARLYFKGFPVLYAPFISFPLSDSRKTGVLTPSYGQSVENGIEVEVPFYWNIAPNYDGTITARNMSDRGTQIKSDWRYLGDTHEGYFEYDFLGSDSLSEHSNRSFYHLVHEHNIQENFHAFLELQGVSDDSYFKDLTTDLALTSQVHLPRRIGLVLDEDAWDAQFDVVHYQSLNYASPPYQIDPRLQLSLSPLNVRDFELGGRLETTRYWHPTSTGATRTLLEPYLQLPIANDYLTVMPKITYHITNYRVQDGTSHERAVPIYSLDTSLVLERDLLFGGDSLKQTLEPRIFYVYAPYRDQSQFPNFDSGLKGFDFSSIFTENLFSGSDRVNDADHLTFGVTSRFYDNGTGSERLNLNVAQRYFMGGNRVSGNTSNRSDILLGANGKISQSWALNSLLQYSGVYDRVERHQHSLRFTPGRGAVINFTHRSDRDLQEQFDLSGQLPITGSWSVAGRWNYSKDSSKLIEGLAGVEYYGGCWGARFVASKVLLGQSANGIDKYATQFMFQIDFNGFTRIGQNAMGLLREKVEGYATR